MLHISQTLSTAVAIQIKQEKMCHIVSLVTLPLQAQGSGQRADNEVNTLTATIKEMHINQGDNQ